MTNKQVNDLSENYMSSRLGIPGTIVFSLLAAVVTTASGTLPLSMTFTAFASALYAYVFLDSKCKWMAAIPAALSIAAFFALGLTPPECVFFALRPIVIALPMVVCISGGKKLFTSIGFTAAAFTLVVGATFLLSLYTAYGSVAEGFSIYITQMKDEMTAIISQATAAISEAYDVEYTLSDYDIESILSRVAVIMPSFLIAVSEILSASAFFSCLLILKIKGRYDHFFKGRLDASISTPTCIFFMISGVCALLFSASNTSLPVSFAFINVCVILFLPLFVQGILNLISGFKSKDVPPGQIRSPGRFSAILTAAFFLILTLYNPLFAFFFLAYYGAYGSVHRALAEYIKKKVDDDNSSY